MMLLGAYWVHLSGLMQLCLVALVLGLVFAAGVQVWSSVRERAAERAAERLAAEQRARGKARKLA
jgi:hypothetical protein